MASRSAPATISNRTGFNASLFRFLDELAANNERDWFQANKQRYESDVLEPALEFISAVGDRLHAVSRQFDAVPKRQGGSLMRVYRDTRFGRDKTPYKTNVGIQFRHAGGRDIHAPGFYLHLEPARSFIGIGLWRPEPAALTAIRQYIADNGGAWKRARDARPFADRFALGGSSLKRPPRGFDPDHRYIEDLKRKDFIASRDVADVAVLDPGFVDAVIEDFSAARPFMRFLCRALDVPF